MNNTLWSLFPKDAREVKTIVYIKKVPFISQTLNLALSTIYVNYVSKYVVPIFIVIIGQMKTIAI